MRVRVNNSFASWFEVISGVPQGSFLGPLLFLIFVNDLPNWITNSIMMFADGTKIWTKIKDTGDGKLLQQDLNTLVEWSKQLAFNTDKCKVMHIDHKLSTVYTMSDGISRPTVVDFCLFQDRNVWYVEFAECLH